jgi:ATP-binding cassette subfamily G (WHITE) protein 2 (SNQ2)
MDKAEEKVQDALNLNHPEDRTGAKPTLAGNQNQPYYAAHAEKDSQTPDNLADVEKESRPQPIPMQLERRQTGVDVKGAESEFAELQREFSKQSQQLSRQHTRQSTKKGTQDVEKAISSGSSDSGEPFDLEDTLRGNKQLEEDSGIKGKKIGVIWDKLTVRGIGGVKNYQPTFPDAFVSFLNVPGTLMSLFGLGGKGKEVNILQDFRGVVKPGEMVLVLGRPGSGCTTFLKVLSNQRFGYTGIDGEVMYGPFTSKDFEKRYRGEAVYCQEDDIHHPTHLPLVKRWVSDLIPRYRVTGPEGFRRMSSRTKSLICSFACSTSSTRKTPSLATLSFAAFLAASVSVSQSLR